MTKSSTICVVIPCYNHGQFLDEAVASVFAQTCQDFEIIIVDDGSSDPETRSLLGDYRRPRTRVVRTENRGLPAARNVGVKLCQTPYICALDADDRLEPSYFEKALEVLAADPSVSFVSHWLRAFGDQEWEWTPERCDLLSLLDMNTVNGAAIVRRQDLLAIGLYDESWRDGCEDWDLWLTMVEAGYPGVILPEVHFHYRRRADSMSRLMNRPTKQLALFERLIEKHGESYQTHLLDLLQRRETNLCDLKGEMFDLEQEYHGWWKPELDRRRAEAETLRRRVEEIRAREAEKAERDRLEAELHGQNLGLRQAREANEHLKADLEGHRGSLANAQEEIEALHGSWSWRLTTPLRGALGWLFEGGRKSS